jgi:signal transduction histidine kinase
MLANLLRPDAEPFLRQELQLLLRNVNGTMIPALLLSTLLAWGLYNKNNLFELTLWVITLMSSKLNGYFHARRHLALLASPGSSRRLVRQLIAMYIIEGAIWGALPWITLDSATEAGRILVLSSMAAILGGAISRLSPVLPVLFAFLSATLIMVSTKVWLLGDPDYHVLGVAGILYLITLTIIARTSAQDVRSSIKLRFENAALIDQLQVKTEIAEAAQNEAEQANLAKSKFLAAASHDLRQPIHAQGLFLEVLARTDLSAHQDELLANARVASEASSEMLNTLLDFSRIEAGVVEQHPQPFYLQTLFNKIEKELGPQADAHKLVFRIHETRIAVQSDPVLVELILRNLVTNAIRYTEHGGILIGCRYRGDQATIEVWDTGIGIEPEHQQEVFSEFHQLGNPERDRRKGLGLGLAIADGLAHSLGHDLSLASTPGRGSVFRLTMPVATSIPVSQVFKAPGEIQLLKVRALVIDDEENVRNGMCHLLGNWGCECDAAESIEEALELARVRPPELIISDYRLREKHTGTEAIAALRMLLGDMLPALLITGDTAPERLREARASGVPLLHKPVSPGQLYRKLVEVLEANS